MIKKQVEVSGPPAPQKKALSRDLIDISFIIDDGMLKSGVKRPRSVKALQEALVVLGYDLGTGGVYNDGVDGDFGPKTEDAVIEFQLDRGFNTANIDGVVGEGTHRELMRALSGQKPVFANINRENRVNMEQKFGSVIDQARLTAKELKPDTCHNTSEKRDA